MFIFLLSKIPKIQKKLIERRFTTGMSIQLESGEKDMLDCVAEINGISRDVAFKRFKNGKIFNVLEYYLKQVRSRSEAVNEYSLLDYISIKTDREPLRISLEKKVGSLPYGFFVDSSFEVRAEIDNAIAKHGPDDWQKVFNPSFKVAIAILAKAVYSSLNQDHNFRWKKIDSYLPALLALPISITAPLAWHYYNSVSERMAIESRELSSKVTELEKKAGIEEFSKFGLLNTVHSLANRNVLAWEEIAQKEYDKIFTALLLNKKTLIYEEKYTKLKLDQNK